jgi:hypothetical protein
MQRIAQADLNLPVECNSVATDYHFFANALDGQTNDGVLQENFRINDATIDSALAGVITEADPWRGYLGPLEIPLDPTESNFYDHAEGDIRSFFLDPEDELVGTNAIRFETERDNDPDANAVGHSLAAVSFAADPVVVCLKPGDVCDDTGTASACAAAEGEILCAFDDCRTDCDTNGLPDACDIALDPSRDCDGDGIMEECNFARGKVVDLVFVLDSYANPIGDWDSAEVCDQIDNIEQALVDEGIIVNLEVVTIRPEPAEIGHEDPCWLEGPPDSPNNVTEFYGTTVEGYPFELGCGIEELSKKDWGPATAIVAAKKVWTPGARRVIVPISDSWP